MEVLRELGCLARTSLAHNDNHLVLSDDVQQLVAYFVHGERPSLLSDGLALGELRHLGCLLLLEHIRILRILSVVEVVFVDLLGLFLLLLLLLGELLLHTQQVTQLRPRQLPEPLTHLGAVLLLAKITQLSTPLLGKHGEVRCGVLDDLHHLLLCGVDDAAVEEGRLELANQHVHLGLLLSVKHQIHLLPLGDSSGGHSV
mmetsp:Transcript_18751/g.45130  ORF Transcript_18751/g.45130 Transcript_18751/m.45130 type:complete len:200 (-) Transcript_18751:1242-1841(-)